MEGAKTCDPLVSQGDSATFLPCFVSFAACIWPDSKHSLLQHPPPRFALRTQRNMPGNFQHCTRGETGPFCSGAVRQTDGGCGRSHLLSCVTLLFHMPVMHRGQRSRGFKMSRSLYSTEHSNVFWGPENSHFLLPSHLVTATIKACCKLLLQSHHGEKEKHLTWKVGHGATSFTAFILFFIVESPHKNDAFSLWMALRI